MTSRDMKISRSMIIRGEMMSLIFSVPRFTFRISFCGVLAARPLHRYPVSEYLLGNQEPLWESAKLSHS